MRNVKKQFPLFCKKTKLFLPAPVIKKFPSQPRNKGPGRGKKSLISVDSGQLWYPFGMIEFLLNMLIGLTHQFGKLVFERVRSKLPVIANQSA